MPNLFIANKKILIWRSLLGEDNSVQPVAAQCPLLGEMPGTEGFEEGVELGAVVGVAEMAELVEDDIVPQLVRKAHEVEIQVDVAFARAASPVRGVVLDADGIIFK